MRPFFDPETIGFQLISVPDLHFFVILLLEKYHISHYT